MFGFITVFYMPTFFVASSVVTVIIPGRNEHEQK